MKDGADRHRRMVVTRGAFVEGGGPTGPLALPIFTAVTAIADKTVRPSLSQEVFLACIIDAKF